MFAYFSIVFFFYVLIQWPTSWHWCTVCITVWHYLTMITVRQGMQALPVDPSEQLSDSISTCDVNKGLLFFCFIFLFCFFFCSFFPFSRDSFCKYSRVQILCCCHITSGLGKTLSYKLPREWRLISFQWTSKFEAGLWISDLDFHCKVFAFCILSEFLTKDVLECIINPAYLMGCLRLHSFQPCPQGRMLQILILSGVI